MKNQQGFTLIELIIVIVILGLLAVTAAPKFIGMQSDARAATLQGLAGTLKSAGNIVYAKAALDSIESAATGTANGVAVVYGYPAATQAALQAAADIPDSDWNFTVGTADANTPDEGTIGFDVTPNDDYNFSTGTCHVTYTPPANAGDSPSIVVVTSGC
jgi:MSHA pilin protein MshA